MLVKGILTGNFLDAKFDIKSHVNLEYYLKKIVLTKCFQFCISRQDKILEPNELLKTKKLKKSLTLSIVRPRP